jgi:hypothetical protein
LKEQDQKKRAMLLKKAEEAKKNETGE